MPTSTEIGIQEFLHVLSNLNKLLSTCSPSFSSASFRSVSCFLISLIDAYKISSGQSSGQSTSAPKIVRKTGLLAYDCSVAISCVT